ncbi:hypothetical protein Moror_9844 [Moniliophthora roreri MCA 2997]|uniref:Uncharacterized protein n=1 Tax=Moniliophthora roreri (strain MCA 2997) TaxID=1381753 RepID=V2Y4G0_MONRO|nr:hypothetical protein Moror_9844 [Moniliophthora roreri MCA 2997]
MRLGLGKRRATQVVAFPWDGAIDTKFASKLYFHGEPNVSQEVYDTCHIAALKPPSTICPGIPNLREYLPDPKVPQFPEHTLALVWLLDQAPRIIYKGLDMRYTSTLFDELAKTLVRDLILSDALPDSLDR